MAAKPLFRLTLPVGLGLELFQLPLESLLAPRRFLLPLPALPLQGVLGGQQGLRARLQSLRLVFLFQPLLIQLALRLPPLFLSCRLSLCRPLGQFLLELLQRGFLLRGTAPELIFQCRAMLLRLALATPLALFHGRGPLAELFLQRLRLLLQFRALAIQLCLGLSPLLVHGRLEVRGPIGHLLFPFLQRCGAIANPFFQFCNLAAKVLLKRPATLVQLTLPGPLGFLHGRGSGTEIFLHGVSPFLQFLFGGPRLLLPGGAAFLQLGLPLPDP